MEWIWILVAIFAATSGSALVVNLLPFSIDKKLNPLVMFLSALIALLLPHIFVIALAMTIPMGLIYGWTGIRLQGHTPVRLPVPETVALVKRLRPPKRVEEREFLRRAYPDPGGHVEKFVPEL